MSGKMLRSCACCAWLAATATFSPSLFAGLILNPSGDTLFNGANQLEWDTAKRVAGLDFRFYSRSVNQIWISENGNLNFDADGSFFPNPLGAVGSKARIAPLWDDFLLLQTPSLSVDNRVRADHQSGKWLASTWENVRLELETQATFVFPSTSLTAQVVIFESDQLIKGFQFRRNDIAFSYVPHVRGTNNFGTYLSATVGLDSGTGAIAPLPGTTAGRITSVNDDLLAWEENSFILFRPNDSLITNYTGSKQFFSAVPEPSAVNLCALALLLASMRYRKRVGGFIC